MDWSDGEIVFRAGLALADGILTGGMVGRLMDVTLWTVGKYADGLERTVVGEDPGAVIAEIEG